MAGPIARGRSARVLVVDDDALILAQIRDALSAGGLTVVTASSAADAVKLCAATPPFDLILGDLQMPGIDGFGFRRQLLADPRTASIPFCFVTGSIRDEDKAMARTLGARAFLRKPVNGTKLLAFARDLLAEQAGIARRHAAMEVIGRRMSALKLAFQPTPGGQSLSAVVPLARGFDNAFTRAPIRSLTLENIDHATVRITDPPHLRTMPPIDLLEVEDVPALEAKVTETYLETVKTRRKQRSIFQRWGVPAEYDDPGFRFLGQLTVGREKFTFSLADEKTLRLYSIDGRPLGARAIEVDVSHATSGVDIEIAIEAVRGTIPAEAAPATAARPPAPLAAPVDDRGEELEPEPEPEAPLVRGHAAPAPAPGSDPFADPEPAPTPAPAPAPAPEEPDALAEDILLVAGEALPSDGTPFVCGNCGDTYLVPDEIDDERLLTTCPRCLAGKAR